MRVFAIGPRKLTVDKDLSGGVQLNFGSDRVVLSPNDAIEFATAVLHAAEVHVKVDATMLANNNINLKGVYGDA